MFTRFFDRLRDPETTADLLLAIKAVVAATVAWALSVGVLGTEIAFMAPWTALLTVHATVHRSLSRGAQTTVASAVGMGLAFVIMQTLGVHVWSFALAIFVGLMGARLSWIRDEGVAIATTAIFIFTADEPLFADRFMELILGVIVGILVNMLVVPPLRDRQAARTVDSINRRIGAVLVDMAQEFSAAWNLEKADAWLTETHSMHDELNSARHVVRLARESRRENPRRIWRRKILRHDDGDPDYEAILGRLDESISQLRNLARTLREATWSMTGWDARFRRGWVEIAGQLGEAIAHPDDNVAAQAERLDTLIAEMSASELPKKQWPVYGALVTSLRHLIRLLADAPSDRSVREPGDEAAS